MSEVVDATAATGGEHILVVDDDPFILKLLEIELRAAGYRVSTAEDGVQALERVREGHPDLVLSDVMMPNLDGLELTRCLRQDAATSAIGVVLLSARTLWEDRIEGISVGADDYVPKPFDTPELLDRIRGVLRGSNRVPDATR